MKATTIRVQCVLMRGIRETGVVWMREHDWQRVMWREFLCLMYPQKYAGEVVRVVNSSRWIDLAPVGSGRHRDDVYIKLEVKPCTTERPPGK